MLNLDKSSETPLYEQIYGQVVERIVDDVYAPETRLPSIRDLAGTLQCSRNTVTTAYKMLVQEGFVVSQPGSGYYITGDRLLLQRFKQEASSFELLPGEEPRRLVDEALVDARKEDCFDDAAAMYDFTYRNLEPGSFPQLEWKGLVDDVLLSPIAVSCNFYANADGESRLREVLARYIAVSRGIHCRPDQIIVQGGTQAALHNLILLFDARVDPVAMEDPGYIGARSVFERGGFRVVPCSVLDDGISFADAVARSGAKLAYTTPSNQFPMGMVMQEKVRRQLLAWAEETDAYVIEDDYCHELNYRNKVQPALATLDTQGRVIYMGTFSKSLSPAMRVNFMVLPDALLERWTRVFSEAYSAVNWIAQETLARYLESGRYSRHIRRIQLRNKKKYEALKSAIATYMGDRVDVIEGGAGLHVLVAVKDGRAQDELIALAHSVGVAVYGTDKYWITHPHPLKSCVLIGFSFIEEQEIRLGIKRLARAWFGE